jgi:general L-amino acid transport system permease protein
MQVAGIDLGRAIYDVRVRAVLYQVLAVVGVVSLGLFLFNNVSTKLAEQNIATGFDYLGREAGFTISQAFIDYQPSHSYGRALLVGIINTIVVSLIACVLATVIGTLVGIARLSKNPLLAFLMLLYVEALRNIPLLLYLFLWYALIVTTLPNVREAIDVGGALFLSNSGLVVPALHWTMAHTGVLVAAIVGIVAAVQVSRRARARRIASGVEATTWPLVIAAFAVPVAIAILVLQPPMEIDWPQKGRFRLSGGMQLTPEFTALLVGLALSASANVAEIVRSGIMAVGKGQWEASRALGIRDGEAMRLVVLPQALRVIIPPMTSTYLSLFKNSSLAIAIGYPDLVMVSNTTMNQTGQAIEAIALFMLVYLSISVAISLFMNWYNARVALKER